MGALIESICPYYGRQAGPGDILRCKIPECRVVASGITGLKMNCLELMTTEDEKLFNLIKTRIKEPKHGIGIEVQCQLTISGYY